MLQEMSLFISINQLNMGLVMMSLISMLHFRKQVLMVLISLEMLALSLFLMLVLTFSKISQPMSICFYMLIMAACEASLALSLLVMMTRLKGNDMLSTISKYKY